MAVDESGSLGGVKRHDYLPFGEEISAGVGGRTTSRGYSQVDSVRQHYTGAERDDETGLDFMQARYYASKQGRFISPDPVAGDRVNPQTLNLYAYVRNNPLRFSDPSGMTPQDRQGRGIVNPCIIGEAGCGPADFGSVEVTATTDLITTTELDIMTAGITPVPIIESEAPILAGVIDLQADSGAPADGGVGNLTVREALLQQAERRESAFWNNIFAGVGYGVGRGLKGFGGLFRAGSGADQAIAVTNPVPNTLARVIPGEGTFTTLGRAGADDVFVTAADDIAGMGANQLGPRLGIPNSNTVTVIEFSTPRFGLASPINRTNPGFVGFGRTSGGAREFVIPNGPIPANARTRIVRQ